MRFATLLLIVSTLLAALWAGLIRLGWDWPVIQATLPLAHGPLMVSAFLGALVTFERAVALGRRWVYLGPVVSAAGGLLLAFGTGAARPLGLLLTVLGSGVLTAAFVVIVRQQWAAYTVTMGIGALAWLVGNLLWAGGRPLYEVVWWWAGFLILTVAGERLELGRLTRLPPRAVRVFGAAVGLLLLGQIGVLVDLGVGVRLTGAALLGLGLWLLRYDIARRTIRRPGLPRFAAWSLLLGYVWLLAAGVLALIVGRATSGYLYDALLHAVFVGFVLSMIFGHAPIIFPAILGTPITFRPALYGPLALLHLSLLLRVGGDLAEALALRRWGGLLNAIALLLYLGMVMGPVLAARLAARFPATLQGRMPWLARAAIQLALGYFVLGLSVGLIAAVGPLFGLAPIWGVALAPLFWHLLVVGWLTQLIFGVAYWMFPKYSSARPRGRAEAAGWALALLNLGLVLRVIGEPLLTLAPGGAGAGLVATSAVAQWLGGVLLVVALWGRVKEK